MIFSQVQSLQGERPQDFVDGLIEAVGSCCSESGHTTSLMGWLTLVPKHSTPSNGGNSTPAMDGVKTVPNINSRSEAGQRLCWRQVLRNWRDHVNTQPPAVGLKKGHLFLSLSLSLSLSLRTLSLSVPWVLKQTAEKPSEWDKSQPRACACDTG